MYRLELVDLADESRRPCVVTVQDTDDTCELRLDRENDSSLVFSSQMDFEEALIHLRQELERQHLLLLCNRYRRDAFVSSMARQMSNGLSCYLVKPRVPVSPDQLVDSLAPAPRQTVVLAEEGAKYIEEWKAGFDD